MLKLKLYGQVIELEEKCDWCDGSGKHYHGQNETCEYCNGIGYRPSENGQVVLDFVRRYTDKD